MDRLYNVEKSRKRSASDSSEEPPRKHGRPKRVSSLMSQYSSITQLGDNTQQQQHLQAISKEMEKEKPRKMLFYLLWILHLHFTHVGSISLKVTTRCLINWRSFLLWKWFHWYDNWRASEASETPSIATYRKNVWA